MTSFDWPDVSYFQAKFGWERVKASKVILNYSKLLRFDKPFRGGLAPPCRLIMLKYKRCPSVVQRQTADFSVVILKIRVVLV